MSLLTGIANYRIGRVSALLVVPLTIALLWLVRVEEKIRVRGVIEAVNQIEVRSPVKDTLVKEIRHRVGDQVPAGEIILTFEDLAGHGFEAERLFHQLSEMEENQKRLLPLVESGATSVRELRELKCRIDVMKVQHRELTEKAARLTVRSPIAGRLVTLDVQPYDQSSIGTLLFTVAGNQERRIICSVPERYFTYLHLDQRVNIKSEVFNYLRFNVYQGRISAISPFGQSQDSDILHEVEIALIEEAQRLTVGSAADLEIVVEGVPLIELIFPRR